MKSSVDAVIDDEKDISARGLVNGQVWSKDAYLDTEKAPFVRSRGSSRSLFNFGWYIFRHHQLVWWWKQNIEIQRRNVFQTSPEISAFKLISEQDIQEFESTG